MWVLEAFYGFADGLMASLVAQFGGGCLGCAGGRRLWKNTTARRSESLRTRWSGGRRQRLRAPKVKVKVNIKSNVKVKGASGGACAASGLAPGRGSRVVCRRTLLVVALVPDSPSRRRRKRNHFGLAVSSRITAAVLAKRPT